jgi:hypothetical protein
MPVYPVGQPEDVLARTMLVVRGRYSFAVDGGAVSTIALTTGTPIPAGATVIGGYIDVVTQVTSGGAATIAIQVESAGDIVAATAVGSWTTGRKNILAAPTSGALTASTAVRTTAARNISAVVATAALTAGVVDVVLYVIPPVA